MLIKANFGYSVSAVTQNRRVAETNMRYFAYAVI